MKKKKTYNEVNITNIKTGEILNFKSILAACDYLKTNRKNLNKAFFYNESLNGYYVEIVYNRKQPEQKMIEDTVEDLPGEVWKTININFYKGRYAVSNMGRIKSFYARNNILMNFLLRDGYFYVQFSYMGISKAFPVAKLVLDTFNPSLIEDNKIVYIDGDVSNIKLSNLKWKYVPYDNLECEIWKEIEGYNNYFVSNFGRVRLGLRLLKQNIQPNGYCRVTLKNNDNDYKYEFVHRLVALAFISRDKYDKSIWNTLQINHIDGKTSNNNVSNLEWVTPRENTLHAFRTGLIKNVKPIYVEYKDFVYTFYTSTEIKDVFPEFNEITIRQTKSYINSHRQFKKKYRLFNDDYKPPNFLIPDLPGEIWIKINKPKDGYFISNKGRIKSLAFYHNEVKLIKPEFIQDTLGVSMYELMAEYFAHVKLEYVYVKDGNRLNYSLDNLLFNKIENLPGEVWKEISTIWIEDEDILEENFDYEISTYGRIRHIRNSRMYISNGIIHENKYVFIAISNENKYRIFVDRLMLLTFSPIKSCKTYDDYSAYKVVHLNNDKLDNKLTNLSWQTIKSDLIDYVDIQNLEIKSTEKQENVLYTYRLKPIEYIYIEYSEFVYTFFSITEVKNTFNEFKDLTDRQIHIYMNSRLWYKDKYLIFNDDYVPFVSKIENLPGETWEKVNGYEGRYYISSKGRLKSFDSHGDDHLIDEKLSKARLGKNVFQLMAESFANIKLNYVYFKDGNNTNISLDNLMFNKMPILEGEIWTKISTIWLNNPPDGLLDKFANYEVSSLGRVRFIDNFRMSLLFMKESNGELSFNVVYKKKHYHIPLRKLMLLSFKPINSCKYEDYINYKIISNKNDYNLANLSWQEIKLDDTWKIIPKYKNYKINIFGDIIDITTNKEVHKFIGSYGYNFVHVRDEEQKRKLEKVHNLMAITFLTDDLSNKYIIHIDDDTSNDALNNLKLITRKDLVRKLRAENKVSFNYTYVEYNSFIFKFVSLTEIAEIIFNNISEQSKISLYLNSGHFYKGFLIFNDNYIHHKWKIQEKGEKWYSIPGFENEYLISNFGRLKHYLLNGKEILLSNKSTVILPNIGRIYFAKLLIETFTNPDDKVEAIYLKSNDYKLENIIFDNTPNYEGEFWRIMNIDWLSTANFDISEEVLKEVKNHIYLKYELSSFGRIRYIKNYRYYFKNPTLCENREKFLLVYKGQYFSFSFSQLMLMTFKPIEFEEGVTYSVRHLDHDYLNNKIDNLEWVMYTASLK